MNFYLDFEATQFSNKIISIGCVAANGRTFETLVNPGMELSDFIIALTGITNEELRKAPDIDTAFYLLYDFIWINGNHEEPRYYCYGSSDKEFIRNSMKDMQHMDNIMHAQSILYALTDYSELVKRYFNSEQAPALRKIFSFIQQTEIVQKHNALEDAKMLSEVADKLLNYCLPEDIDKIKQIPNQEKPLVNIKKAPIAFTKLEGSMWTCDTGDATDYQIQCLSRDNKVKYFADIETAVMWVIKYITNGSPKDNEIVKKRQKNIIKAAKGGKKYCGLVWKMK